MTKQTKAATIPGLGPEGAPAAVYVAPAKIRGWAGNPKKISEADITAVMGSMQRFGFGSPILVRSEEEGEIIAGHLRMLAAVRLGVTVVPVRYMTHLSFEEAHALNLADNKLAKNTAWDEELLRVALDLAVAANISADLLGFSPREMERLFAPPPEVEVFEVDVSDLHDEFFLSVRGPVPQQPEVLEILRASLATLPGIIVDVGLVKR